MIRLSKKTIQTLYNLKDLYECLVQTGFDNRFNEGFLQEVNSEINYRERQLRRENYV